MIIPILLITVEIANSLKKNFSPIFNTVQG